MRFVGKCFAALALFLSMRVTGYWSFARKLTGQLGCLFCNSASSSPHLAEVPSLHAVKRPLLRRSSATTRDGSFVRLSGHLDAPTAVSQHGVSAPRWAVLATDARALGGQSSPTFLARRNLPHGFEGREFCFCGRAQRPKHNDERKNETKTPI